MLKGEHQMLKRFFLLFLCLAVPLTVNAAFDPGVSIKILHVTQNWIDNSDELGIRPDEITVNIVRARLPEAYQEIEYVLNERHSDRPGYAYIDTGVSASASSGIRMDSILFKGGTRVLSSLSNTEINGYSTENIHLFGTPLDPWYTKYWGISRIYGVKIYNGDELIRDYVPCFDRATGDVGFYDLVKNKFL